MNNQELKAHYTCMYQEAIARIEDQDYQLDRMIDQRKDNRRGITLLFRPKSSVRERIANFLKKTYPLEPDQYYYPTTDMHVTVLSIVSCRADFLPEEVDLQKVKHIIRGALEAMPVFSVDFRGITASPSCILVQGFPNNNTLNLMRKRLREAFAQSNLGLSIDARYTLSTAHATVIRFRKPLHDHVIFCNHIGQYREVDFGSSQVDAIELVYNDWYQREARTKHLGLYPLL